MKQKHKVIFWIVVISATFACSSLPFGGSQNSDSSTGGQSSNSGSDSGPIITVTPAVALPPTWTPTSSDGGHQTKQRLATGG